MGLQVLTEDDANDWARTLATFPESAVDIYFTPAYLATWRDYETATPVCLRYSCQDVVLLYPFLVKDIDGYSLQGYRDAFSAYGYGGVISNVGDVPVDVLGTFNANVDRWCLNNRIVAEFVRDHPLLSHQANPLRAARYVAARRNVYCSFDRPLHLAPSARRNLRRAHKSNLTVAVDEHLNSLDVFQRLYAMTADRLRMRQFYRFDTDYFARTKSLLGAHACLINVLHGGQIVAASLLFSYGRKCAYHLGASDFDHARLRPNDLLFEAMTDYARARGMRYLSLGGGTSNDADDSLFRFKRKFGNRVMDFNVGTKVHQHGVYTKLCQEWEARHRHLADNYRHFFLKYRVVD